MLKTLYVLRHATETVYLRSPKFKTMTDEINQGFRALTKTEAQSWSEMMPVPLQWIAVPIVYDTLLGQAVGEGEAPTAYEQDTEIIKGENAKRETVKKPTQYDRIKELCYHKLGERWAKDVKLSIRADNLSWLVYLIEKGIAKAREEFAKEPGGMQDMGNRLSVASWMGDVEALVDQVEKQFFPLPK
jgi:hypothetical protein